MINFHKILLVMKAITEQEIEVKVIAYKDGLTDENFIFQRTGPTPIVNKKNPN